MSVIENKYVDLDKVYDVLWEVLSTEFSLQVIRANQAGERPQGLYATLLLNPGPAFSGIDEERFSSDVDDNLQVTTTGQRELTLSLNLYGPSALVKMSQIQTRMQTRSFKENLFLTAQGQNFGLYLVSALSSQDLSELLQSEYEKRAQMDVSLRTTSAIVEQIGPIESADIDANVINEADEIVDDGNFTIDIP